MPGQQREASADYAQATRLLTQLRTVARQLPGTLDPGSIAERLLDEIRAVAPADRSAVLIGSGGGRLVVFCADRHGRHTARRLGNLARQGRPDRRGLAVAAAADLRQLGHPYSRQRRRDVDGAAAGHWRTHRRSGVVAEADRARAFDSSMVSAAATVAASSVLRLETALLFDDVRSLATTEERQRLAREIHDGVHRSW
ncbi:hypothetical protein [Fodinicola feengrottensis]|uniref:hypothetical protein n=1 Tax=Fodinicola feengrottensis TaxID=435914 RepID=UPI0013D7DC8C|nr:hypothetical protein [Fodinicola feengrottensis]